MTKRPTFVTIFFLSLVVSVAKNLMIPDSGLKTSSHKLSCYDTDDDDEIDIKATDYMPEVGIDKNISYCKVSGMWILYDEDNYNGSASFWMYGYNNMVTIPTEFENKVSSLRFPGAPDDWKATSLNIYNQENFMGEEEFTYEDISNFTIEAKSIIVTGCKPWTVYMESNYQGESKCIYPSDIKMCTPGLFPSVSSLKDVAGKIFSARRGCQGGEQMRNKIGAISCPSGASGILPLDGYVKLFSHYVPAGLFTSYDDVGSKNPCNPEADLYSILDQLETYRNTEGKFHFKLCYPELTWGIDGKTCNEWIQSSNPYTESNITDFEAISLAFKRDSYRDEWRGLGKNIVDKDNRTIIDDSPMRGNVFSSLGALEYWNKWETIAGPRHNIYGSGNYSVITKVELFAKIE